jgi:hypothetical protein
MNLSREHIEIVKEIVKEVCSDSGPVPRARIFSIFQERTNSDIEKYKFVKDVSELIRTGTLPGYCIKVGRKGGISKNDSLEQVTVTCASGKYVGLVSKEPLSNFISSMKNTQFTTQQGKGME